jgi:hypothetical protein
MASCLIAKKLILKEQTFNIALDVFVKLLQHSKNSEWNSKTV